jgi:hypothetical protein
MGIWSDAVDGWDDGMDWPLETFGADGYAGVYHHRDDPLWGGPTAFWKNDRRAPMAWYESKTWEQIFVWSDPIYQEDTMFFALEANMLLDPPPGDRKYELTLVGVPDGIEGAPEVGTTWTVPHDGETLYVELPNFSTVDGLEGYEFEFLIEPAPDNCWGTPLGDANCDGELGFTDINYFVSALIGEGTWAGAWPEGEPPCEYLCAADVNEDGVVDFADINPFVLLLSGPTAE